MVPHLTPLIQYLDYAIQKVRGGEAETLSHTHTQKFIQGPSSGTIVFMLCSESVILARHREDSQ